MDCIFKSLYPYIYVWQVVGFGHKLGGVSNIYGSSWENCHKYLSNIIDILFRNDIINCDEINVLKVLLASNDRSNLLIALEIIDNKCNQFREKRGWDDMTYKKGFHLTF